MKNVTHFFGSCSWPQFYGKKKLQSTLLNIFELLDLVLQSAILGLSELNHQHYLILNQLLLIFKFDVYKARDSKKNEFQSVEKKHSESL